jgi:hypothetical protein
MIFFAGILCSSRGDEGEQLSLHDPGLRRRRPHGRHDRWSRCHPPTKRTSPTPPGTPSSWKWVVATLICYGKTENDQRLTFRYAKSARAE